MCGFYMLYDVLSLSKIHTLIEQYLNSSYNLINSSQVIYFYESLILSFKNVGILKLRMPKD